MQMVFGGYRGLSLLFQLNWDHILYVATLLVSLMAGAFLGHYLL